jgi:succinoglycan biosynthesis protein ExoM
MATPNQVSVLTSDDRGSSRPTVAATATKHICICTCTYKRAGLLERLLDGLAAQETENLFTYSIVIADNDAAQSAKSVVEKFSAQSSIPILYCVEPQQNIALARNKAIANADGDFVAFIDDDEFPESDWLLQLFRACDRYGVDGVLGPVKRHFDEEPPHWLAKGKFYDRPTGPTGSLVTWLQARTGNVLLKQELFASQEPPFRPQFRAGEDQDFFRRMMEKGRKFVWCNDAVAYEVVPPQRWKRAFLLKQALLRGATARLQPNLSTRGVAKSLVAVPAYAAALPFAFVLGHHWFMTLLVKICDHLGKLLALVGINPIKQPYVTD